VHKLYLVFSDVAIFLESTLCTIYSLSLYRSYEVTMPDDIYDAIRPLYYISKIFGLAPFSCVTEAYSNGVNYRRYKFSLFNVFYSAFIIVVSFIAFIIVISWRIQHSYATDKHLTIILTDANVFCLNSLLALLSLLKGAVFNKRRMLTLLNRIARIDKMLLPRPRVVYKKTYIFSLLQVCYLFCTCILFYCYHSWVWVGELSSKNFQHLPFSYLIRSIIYVMETQYINFILLLRHRFREINISLQRLYNNDYVDLISKLKLNYARDSGIFILASESNMLSQRIHMPFTTRRVKPSGPLEMGISSNRDEPAHRSQLFLMRGIHYILCDLASSVERMYGLQILVDFTVSFITLTTCIYFSIQFITQFHTQNEVTENESVIKAFCISLVWLSLVTIRLVTITASCNAASTEANHVTHILQRILLEPQLHPHTLKTAKLFLQQVTHRPLHFTAWGFFTINYTALGTIIGSVATYLVILLQF
jgi:gustatory receptor